tara:strand:- start:1196 stop:1786 length:591 start_codon:yes stop_codon:yes gene_type:complete
MKVEEIRASICEQKPKNIQIEGSLWMKVDSPDAKGQFPAEIRVIRKNDILLEVTNLLGGTEAVVRLKNSVLEITRGTRVKKLRSKDGVWAGIPVKWAALLMRGEVPCVVGLSEVPGRTDQRVFSNQNETYIYEFRKWNGKPWVEKVIWIPHQSPKDQMVIIREQPEDKTGDPKIISIESRRGNVKLRWKKRKVLSI